MGRYYNDFSDTHDESLMHWKYLRRYMKNGKWQYVYEGMGDSVDNARKALRRTAKASKKTMNAARDAVVNNVGNYATAAGKAISKTVHNVGKRAGVVQTPVADAVNDHLKTKRGGLYGGETIKKSVIRRAQEERHHNINQGKTPFKDRALYSANNAWNRQYVEDQITQTRQYVDDQAHHQKVMTSKGRAASPNRVLNSQEYIDEYEFNTRKPAKGNRYKTKRR